MEAVERDLCVGERCLPGAVGVLRNAWRDLGGELDRSLRWMRGQGRGRLEVLVGQLPGWPVVGGLFMCGKCGGKVGWSGENMTYPLWT